MNAAEDRLSELMDAATCALDPPIDAILAAGERLGRTRRRRRRAAVAAGTAAVVLLAGAGVAAGISFADPDRDYGAAGQVTRTSHPAAPVPDSRAPALVPAVSATAMPGSPTPTAGLVPINATAAANILRKLVASNWKFGTFPESSTGSLLRVNVDDGFGIAQIFVGIGTGANSGMDPVDCALQGPLLKAGAANSNLDSCRVATFSNGDKAMEEILTPPQSRIIMYRIIVSRSDGIALEITAQNGDPDTAATEVTRTMPPLSVGVWTAVALNRMWQLEVSPALAK